MTYPYVHNFWRESIFVCKNTAENTQIDGTLDQSTVTRVPYSATTIHWCKSSFSHQKKKAPFQFLLNFRTGTYRLTQGCGSGRIRTFLVGIRKIFSGSGSFLFRIRTIFIGYGSQPGYVKLNTQGQIFFLLSFFTFSGGFFHFFQVKECTKTTTGTYLSIN